MTEKMKGINFFLFPWRSLLFGFWPICNDQYEQLGIFVLGS